MESNLHLQIKCALPVRVTRASPGRGTKEGERKTERERVDYRDEEEVDDGVVTAGGSCKIKRRLLLC